MQPVRAQFDNAQDLVAACLAAPKHPQNARLLTLTHSRGFTCSDRREITTYEQALDALKAATFQPGVDRIEKCRKGLELPAPVSIRRRVVRGDWGDTLDLDLVRNGQLDIAWSRARRTTTHGASRVAVGIHGSDNGSVSAQDIAWRGVAAIALTDALEAAGYSVLLRTMVRAQMHPTSGSGARYEVDVTLKADGMPLDLHAVANLAASTAMFRGACFRHIIVSADVPISSGLGHNDFRSEIEHVPGFDFTCEATAAIRDAATANAWIAKQIAALDATHTQ